MKNLKSALVMRILVVALVVLMTGIGLVIVPKTANAQLASVWSTDKNLTNSPEVNDYNPAIAVDHYYSDGRNIHVVWDDGLNVHYIRSTNGGASWGSSQIIAYAAINPAIAAYGDNIHVVYQRQEIDHWEIFYHRSTDNGTSWDITHQQISDPDEWSSFTPDIAYDGVDGIVHVVWDEPFREGHPEVYYDRSTDNGITWSTDIQLSDFDTTASHAPSIGADLEVHVVWVDTRDGRTEIYFDRSTDDGVNWLASDKRLTNVNSNKEYPKVDVYGDFDYVVWSDDLPGNKEVYLMRSSDRGVTWDDGQLNYGVGRRLTNNSALSINPAVAVTGWHVLNVVWEDHRYYGVGTLFHRSSEDQAANFGSLAQITTATTDTRDPDIDGPTGTYGTILHVVWEDYRDGNWEIYYQNYTPGYLSVSKGPDSPPDHTRYYDPAASPYNEMLQIRVKENTGEESVRIDSIRLVASGTGDDKNGISQVLLVHDANENGIYDAGETTLASGTYSSDNGTLVLTIAGGHVVAAGATDYLLVVYTIDWCSVKPGDTFTFYVQPISATGVNSGQPSEVAGLPIWACTKTIVAADTIGVYNPATATFFLRNSNTSGVADITFNYGMPNWIPITGDWNNDGTDTIGVYNPATATFFLRDSNTSGVADHMFNYGMPNWTPIAGDWNNDGTDTIGLYDPNTATFFLRNSNTTGVADHTFNYGMPNWTPLAGDWNNDGTDTIGVYNPATATFFLRDSNTSGVADHTFNYGMPNWIPITGDWDVDGDDTVGLYNATTATFFLRNTNSSGVADYTFNYGMLNWTPLVGDWEGNGGLSSPLSVQAAELGSGYQVLCSPNPALLGGKVTFQVMGAGIDAVKVLIYDLGGGLVYQSEFVSGCSLTWDLRSEQATLVANGIYLYTVTVKAYGKLIPTKVGRLLILR